MVKRILLLLLISPFFVSTDLVCVDEPEDPEKTETSQKQEEPEDLPNLEDLPDLEDLDDMIEENGTNFELNPSIIEKVKAFFRLPLSVQMKILNEYKLYIISGTTAAAALATLIIYRISQNRKNKKLRK